jgi:hypothetical protein
MTVRRVVNRIIIVMYSPELSSTLVAVQTPSHMFINSALCCSAPLQFWASQKGQSGLVFFFRIIGKWREERVCMLI